MDRSLKEWEYMQKIKVLNIPAMNRSIHLHFPIAIPQRKGPLSVSCTFLLLLFDLISLTFFSSSASIFFTALIRYASMLS